MDKYLIGVDGGGTKTEVVLVSRNGTIIARIRGGSTNFQALGGEKLKKEHNHLNHKSKLIKNHKKEINMFEKISRWAYNQCLNGNDKEEMRNIIHDNRWIYNYCYCIEDRKDLWSKLTVDEWIYWYCHDIGYHNPLGLTVSLGLLFLKAYEFG